MSSQGLRSSSRRIRAPGKLNRIHVPAERAEKLSYKGLDLQPDGLTAGLAGHCQPDKKIFIVSDKKR